MSTHLARSRRLGFAILFAFVIASPLAHALSSTCSAPGVATTFNPGVGNVSGKTGVVKE
jgi:hypothetical protein